MINDNFELALAFTLKWEGGLVDHPSDPGGRTNQGITQAVLDTWRTLQGLPLYRVDDITDDEVRAIYEKNYWKAGRCNDLEWNIAICHFDACVNHGVFQASKLLQAVVSAKQDGIIGPVTLAAVACQDSGWVTQKYLLTRRQYYINLADAKPEMNVFLTGWQNRVIDLEKYVGAI